MFRSIQYLRAIAALSIVFKHAAHPGGAVERALDGGVDLFFVISGFVMVVSTHGRELGAVEFLQHRARRILPMWWITLALVAVLGLGRGDLGQWLSSVFLIPYYVAENGLGQVSWGVGWTLCFEALFYVLFAIGLAARSQRFILYVLACLFLAGIALGRSDLPILNDAMHPLLLEFLAGVIVGQLAVSRRLIPAPWLFLIIGSGFYLSSSFLNYPEEWRPAFRGVPLAIAVAAAVAWEAKSGMRDLHVLRFLGDASYSIYLLHYVPIMLTWRVIGQDSLWPITAALAIASGCLAYMLVEKPLLEILKSRRKVAV